MIKELTLDSNVFIRLIVKDVKSHFEKARKLLEEIEKGKIKGKVSILVINEIIWILENYYYLKREDYIPRLLKFLTLKNIKIIEVKKNLIIKILRKVENTRFDFTDIYLSEISTKETLFSFDKDFKKLYK